MYGLNWFIPALVSRRVGSFGISEEDGTIRCSRSSKKRRNVFRIWFASTARSVYRPGYRRPEASGSAQHVLGHAHPELGGQPQRLLVDALVVAVEHRHELVERDVVAEQARPVGDRTGPAEEAGVGCAHDHERNHPSPGHESLG